MKKHPILFIYSFLCVSCISFSQLYAARPKLSSVPNSFREALIKDKEKSLFVETVFESINEENVNYKWRAVKSTNCFVALTNVTFKDSEQKKAYKTFLENALQDAKNNSSAQEQLRNVGTVYLVYQGPDISYYVGGRGGALSLFTKVSEDQHKQFSVQKQAKRILLDTESLRTLLSQEFKKEPQEFNPLKESFSAIKEVLCPGENMIKNLYFDSIKAGSFFLYSFEKGSENCFNSALNKMFKTIQENKKGPGPFPIGKTETFEYFLQQKKGKNARLHVKFCDSKKFNNYLKNNNENNPMEVSDHEELESLSHEELESLKHAELESLKHADLESLKHADLLKIRETHINTIKKDLEMKPGSSPHLTLFYTLPDKTAVKYGLKTQEETDCSYLSYNIKGSLTKIQRSLTTENNKTLICSNKQNGWEYWYLPSSKCRIYIKVPNDVGEIFKKTSQKKVDEAFAQPACKQVILDDIHERNDIAQMLNSTNDAVKLKQVFGMNDMTHELSNIALFMPGNVLRIQLKSTNVERSNTGQLFNTDLTVEGLFENSHSLKGKKYTYSLISSRDGKQKFVKVDGIDDLNALRVQKNRTDPLKEESYYDENESSFQNSNSNDACDLHDANIFMPNIFMQEEDDIFMINVDALNNDAFDLHDANSSKPQRLQEEDDIFFDD